MKHISHYINHLFFAATFIGGPAVGQQSYTFTPAGATGSLGPSQSMVNTAYSSSNLSGSVVVSPQGIQNFTIPITGPYRIEARGGQGYGTYGGRGAIMIGDFTLTAGTVLKIAVGQAGILPANSSYNQQFGGGGGSFVTYTNNTPLVVAGGGGGSHASSFQANSDGTVSSSGNSGAGGTSNGTGGTGGGGGGTATSADGGGGLTGSGSGTAGGQAFTSGGHGGGSTGVGGFGGGGGTSSYNNYRGGGGGGYSGGGGSQSVSGPSSGGGGGSYNAGANQNNTSGANLGDGTVIITELCPLQIIASGATSSVDPVICSGQSLTLTTTGVSNYSWSTGATSSSIVVAPTTNTVFSIVATTSINCSTTAYMSVTVSPGVPTLTISQSSNSICLGNTVTLDASGALTYTWANGFNSGDTLSPTSTTNYTVYGTNGCGTSTAMTTVSVTPLPVTAAASSMLICESTTVGLSAGGATTYTWAPTMQTGSNIVSSASVTTIFTVTGETGNCLGTNTILINTKPNPTISIVGTGSNVCVGNTVGLTVSGAITYTWVQANLTGTSVVDAPTVPTLYQVSGTNSVGCTSTAQYVVVPQTPPALTSNLSSTVICKGDSTMLSAGGASSYTWSTGSNANAISVAPSASTVYSVIAGHNTNSCTASESFTVNVAVPVLGVSANTAICEGGVTTLTAGPGQNFNWSNGGGSFPTLSNISPSVTTIYTVTADVDVDNIQCPASNTVQVTVNPNPTVSVSATSTTVCKNQPVQLTASGASTYVWSNNQTGATITFSSSSTSPQTPSVTGTDANGCSSVASIVIFVNSCNGIAENANTGSFYVFPNPSSGAFTVKSDSKMRLTIVNTLGQQVGTPLETGDSGSIEITGLAPGTYFLVATTPDGSIAKAIVVQ